MFDEKERHLWIKSTHDEQRALIAMNPDAFFVPSYVGSKGWIGVVVSKADRGEVEELITEAWRLTAPKRLVAAFDEGRRLDAADPLPVVRRPRRGSSSATAARRHLAYPADPEALSDAEWAEFLFMRDNPKGEWAERWMHAAGCRRWFNAIRDTATHRMVAPTGWARSRPA